MNLAVIEDLSGNWNIISYGNAKRYEEIKKSDIFICSPKTVLEASDIVMAHNEMLKKRNYQSNLATRI